MTSPSGGDQYQQGAGAPGTPHGPKITSVFDFSAEALEQIAFWLEQRGLHIPVAQIIGYQQGRPTKSTSSVDVTNTTTATDILNEKIQGGFLGTTGALKITMFGDLLNNVAAGSVNHTFSVLLGGTTLATTGPVALGSIAARQGWFAEIVIANIASASAQQMFARADQQIFTTLNGSGAVDTTQTQTLQVQYKFGTATANCSCRRFYYIMEPVF